MFFAIDLASYSQEAEQSGNGWLNTFSVSLAGLLGVGAITISALGFKYDVGTFHTQSEYDLRWEARTRKKTLFPFYEPFSCFIVSNLTYPPLE